MLCRHLSTFRDDPEKMWSMKHQGNSYVQGATLVMLLVHRNTTLWLVVNAKMGCAILSSVLAVNGWLHVSNTKHSRDMKTLVMCNVSVYDDSTTCCLFKLMLRDLVVPSWRCQVIWYDMVVVVPIWYSRACSLLYTRTIINNIGFWRRLWLWLMLLIKARFLGLCSYRLWSFKNFCSWGVCIFWLLEMMQSIYSYIYYAENLW